MLVALIGRSGINQPGAEMKLLKKQISEKDGAGSVLLRAEEPEDMWHIYNLILVGDSVKTTTVRKVRGARAVARIRPSLCALNSSMAGYRSSRRA